MPASAGAEPRWFAPQPISPFGWSIADAEIDPAGKSVALLASSAGLATTTRPGGGAFAAPQGLPYVTGDEPQMGIDDQGGTVVAWRAQPSGIRQATVKGATGGWQPPVNLSDPNDFNSNLWTLDVGADGTAAVAWRGGQGMRIRVRPPDGTFGPVEEVPIGARTLYLDRPLIHVDGTGGVHLFMGADNGEVLYAERPVGGPFGAPEVLLEDAVPAPGQIASSPGGALAVSWGRFTYTNPDNFLESEAMLFVRDSDDAELGPSQVMPAESSSLAVADDGAVLSVWIVFSSDHRRAWVQTAARTADGQIGDVATISSTSGAAREPAVGLDEDGEALVVWQQAGPQAGPFPGVEPAHVEAAVRAPGQGFGAPVVLSPDTMGGSSALSASRAGTAVAIWTESVGGRSCVKAVVRAEASQPGDARTCAQVPAPIVPGGTPDVTPPGLKFAGARVVKLTSSVLTLTATCTEACVMSGSGTVTTAGAARTYKFKGAKTKLVPAGKKAKLRLKLSRRSYKAVRRALKRKRKVKAAIKVTARDTAGINKTFKRTLKLKRSR